MYNGQTTDNYHSPSILGYNHSDLLLDPLTYQYHDFAATRNSQPVRIVEGEYSPDYVARTAYEFLDHALNQSQPFFLTAAPNAPHGEGTSTSAGPPPSAPRHEHLFTDYRIPRNPNPQGASNFNPDVPSGVSWVRHMPPMNASTIATMDEYQRRRLRSLQSVDEMIEQLVLRLDAAGALSNTHFFFSSDNGYHIAQHRLYPGKMLGFDEDIRVPLVWRGPGVPQGQTRRSPTSHSDLAPTIMDIAGLSYHDREFDGAPLDLHSRKSRGEHVGIEFWGRAVAETPDAIGAGGYDGTYADNTYKGLRIDADAYGLYYAVWCTRESELYNMKVSSTSLHTSTYPLADWLDRPRADGQPPVPQRHPPPHAPLPPTCARRRSSRRPDAGPQVVQGRDVHPPLAHPAPGRRRVHPCRRHAPPLRRFLRGAAQGQL